MDVAIGLPNTVPGTQGDQLIEFARRGEAAGFSSLGTLDRLIYAGYEPLTSLAAAAAVTDRIPLATTVLLAPYRLNGVLLAKEAGSGRTSRPSPRRCSSAARSTPPSSVPPATGGAGSSAVAPPTTRGRAGRSSRRHGARPGATSCSSSRVLRTPSRPTCWPTRRSRRCWERARQDSNL